MREFWDTLIQKVPGELPAEVQEQFENLESLRRLRSLNALHVVSEIFGADLSRFKPQ